MNLDSLLDFNSPVFYVLLGLIAGVLVLALAIFITGWLSWRMVRLRAAEKELRSAHTLNSELDKAGVAITEKVAAAPEPAVASEVSTKEEAVPGAAAVTEPAEPDIGSSAPDVIKSKPAFLNRYTYHVTGNKEPFTSLRDAMSMFPAELKKRPKDWTPEWARLPGYIQDNIRREEVTE